MSLRDNTILLTGGGGFLGRRILVELEREGVTSNHIIAPRSADGDLRDGAVCERLMEGVDIVIHAAAHVGGIEYNRTHPGTLLYDNAIMAMHLFEAARKNGVKKFIGIGSVCEYPAQATVPFQEDQVWQGYPEVSNGAYGIAKRLMLAQGQAYRDEFGLNAIHLLLINLFGPGDHFTSERSHVIAALTNKFITAKESKARTVTIWGSGKATREFLYVDDAARAVVLATERYDKSAPVNIGSGQEVSIRDLAEALKAIIGYDGELVWDTTKPDGQMRRQLDVTRAEREFGFTATTSFLDGLRATVDDFLSQRKNI